MLFAVAKVYKRKIHANLKSDLLLKDVVKA